MMKSPIFWGIFCFLIAKEKKQKRKQTDKEIDKMVYELYGLSDEEIKTVGGIMILPRSHHSDENAYVSLYGCNMCSNAVALEREKIQQTLSDKFIKG